MDGTHVVTRAGETLAARYRLDRHLGDDGPAEVYIATDTQEEISVVVRVLRPELALQAHAVNAFTALPKSLVKVAPPHMARVFSIGSDDTGIPFVIEEAISAPSLATHLTQHDKGLTPAEANAVLAPIIEAVARLHLSGVTHGKLDPSRVLLAQTGATLVPRLAHFSTQDARAELSRYVAPEARGKEASDDPARDVWSLGVLIHHVLAGHVPRDQVTREQLAQSLPNASDALRSAIADALAHDVRKRLPDAATLWMRVETALRDAATPLTAPPRTSTDAAANTQTVASANRLVAAVEVAADPIPAASLPDQRSAFDLVAEPAVASETSAAKPVVDVKADAPVIGARFAAPARAFKPLAGDPMAGWDGVSGKRPAVGIEADLGVGEEAELNSGDTLALATGGSASNTTPTPATTRARELNSAQMRTLLQIGAPEESRAWPWVRVAMMLLLLLLLYFSLPYVSEPDLAEARRVLGAKVKIASVVLSAVTVVAALRTWIYSVKARVFLMRPAVYSFAVVAICICVLASGAFAASTIDPELGDQGMRAAGRGGVFRGMARNALPYAVTMLFLSAGMYGLLHAIRSFRISIGMSVMTLLLSAAAMAGSVDITVSTIKPQIEEQLEARKRKGKGEPELEGNAAQRYRNAVSDRKIDVNAMSKDTDIAPGTVQRTTIGDGNDGDVIENDVKRQRQHQMDVIKEAERQLPVP